jgi:hypothetical protein
MIRSHRVDDHSQIDISKLSFREEILLFSLRSPFASSYRRSSDTAIFYNRSSAGKHHYRGLQAWLAWRLPSLQKYESA